MDKKWHCYCLVDSNQSHTYVGATNNPARRLQCHNGLRVGGARYTKSHRPWTMYFLVSGFESKHHALSFEWHWKFWSRKHKGKPLWKRHQALVLMLLKPENRDLECKYRE
jgi:predicted GIY-YIG superfamily endonuclease